MSEDGAAGAGVLLLFAVTLSVFLLVGEFLYAYGVKQSVDIELSRAANTAVDLAMSDAHRQDHLSELDVDAAYLRFYEYLYNDMKLSARLESISHGGKYVYSLAINNIVINSSPPGLQVAAVVSLQPVFLGRLSPAPIRFSVRGRSINRRRDI
jgi:hypothetical protein